MRWRNCEEVDVAIISTDQHHLAFVATAALSGTHNVADGIGDVAANVERIDGAIVVDPITILQGRRQLANVRQVIRVAALLQGHLHFAA